MQIFFAILLLVKTLFALEIQEIPPEENPAMLASLHFPYLLTEEGLPSPPLLELLQSCDIEHEGTLEDIVQKTQKNWYQGGKERWELEEKPHFEKDRIFPILEKLQVLEVVESPVKKFDYALVHGALLERVRMRLAFLANEWKKGVRFSKIIFLTGDRLLLPQIEDSRALLDHTNSYLPFRKSWVFQGELPKNEAEMMELVYEQADLPEEMRELPVEWVFAPMQEKNGKKIRPGTRETILAWLKNFPIPGTCLAVSNQPYVGYQDSIVRTYLPNSFSLLTVGPAADEKTSLEIHLDNISRWLYQEKIRLSYQQKN